MRLIYKPASLWLLAVFLMLVGLLNQLTAPELPIETNILALLPQDQQNPAAQKAFDKIANKISDQVLFLVKADSEQQVINAATAFSKQLESLSLFQQITGKISQDQQQEWAKLYYPKRFQLLTNEQRERLTTDPAKQTQKVIQEVYNPFSGVSAKELNNDPFLLFRDHLASLAHHAGEFQLQQGFLIRNLNQHYYGLISATLNGSAYSPNTQSKLKDLQLVQQSIEAKYQVNILHTGVIFYAAHGTQSAKNEISTIGLGSLIGVILLLLIVYRSMLPLALALISIATGLLAGFVLTVAFFGKVHLFSLVFGASLIGVSIDYAFHYLTDRLSAGSKWNAQAGLQHIFMAITLGLITSLIGYLSMLAAPFPGLQQLAMFSAVGLTSAYLTVVCWYPKLAAKPSADRKLPFVHWINAYLNYWLSAKVKILLPSTVAILSLIGLYHVSYSDDIRQLQALPTQIKQQENEITSVTGMGSAQQMLLVTASDDNALLNRLSDMDKSLGKLIKDKVLTGYQNIADYVPSIDRQKQDFKLVENLYETQGQHLKESLGLKNSLELSPQFTPLTLSDFFASNASKPLRTLYLGDIEKQKAAVILLNGVTNPEPIKALAAVHQDVSYLNKADEVSRVFSHYRVRITELVFIAYMIIFVLLGFKYGVQKGALLIIPPAIAAIAGLAVTNLTGIPLNLFNLLAIILILGIGIDYTLFFAEQKHLDPEQTRSTLLSISLSAITTLLSFGLLALSETMAIHSFGITVLTGIIIAWLLAPMSLHAPNKRES